MRRFIKLMTPVIAASVLLVSHVSAHAQAGDTIAFTVPYSAGGAADTVARRLADIIRKQTGKVLVVENQGGAGGAIGAAAVARAGKDERRVMLASSSAVTIVPNLRQVSYDPLRDLVPVAGVAMVPVAILATRDAPFKDFQGMLDYAKANPDAVRYATPGAGSVAHLAIEGLQMRAGVSLTHIPYKGESPAIQDALGGVMELLVVNTPTLIPHVQAGSLRPLAVLEPERLAVWPDVPTLAEAGFDKHDYNSDFGIYVSANMPEEVRKEISTLFANAVASDEFKETLNKLSMLPNPLQGAQYAEKIAAEHARNAEIIKVRNIRPE